MKTYKILRGGEEVITLIPGRYAGLKQSKIFGRLDCKLGMRVRKRDRVFFTSWTDALAAGYRPCKNCKPKTTDKYPEQEILRKNLLAGPHIALCGTPTGGASNDWSVCLSWKEGFGDNPREIKHVLVETTVYQEARAQAVAAGLVYNFPVLQHIPGDIICIGIPVRTNDIEAAAHRRTLRDFLKEKGIHWFPW